MEPVEIMFFFCSHFVSTSSVFLVEAADAIFRNMTIKEIVRDYFVREKASVQRANCTSCCTGYEAGNIATLLDKMCRNKIIPLGNFLFYLELPKSNFWVIFNCMLLNTTMI